MAALVGILIAGSITAGLWPLLQAKTLPAPWVRAYWEGLLPKSNRRRLPALFAADQIDQCLVQAGRPWGLTGQRLIFFRLLVAGFLILICSFAGHPLLGLGLGSLIWYAVNFLLTVAISARHRRIAAELPAFLDLWAALVGVGETVEGALVEIIRRHPDFLVSAEMRRVLDRVAASGLFGESLVAGAIATGSSALISVAEQIRHCMDAGGAISFELSHAATRLRDEGLANMMHAAGAAAVAGIFPKLFSIFLSLLPVLAAIILTVVKQV